MKVVTNVTRTWMAYSAMTFLFVACYCALHIVRSNFVEIPARATIELPIALLLLADWMLLLLFSVVQLMRRHRIGIYSLATTLLFFLMLFLPATT